MLTKLLVLLLTAAVLLGCDSDDRPPSDVGSPADGSVPPTGGTGGAGTGGGSPGGTGGGADDDAGSLGDDAGSANGTDAAAADAGPVLPDAGVDAFDGMCANSRWSTVSDACWSCWCTTCAATLNVATRRSMEIFECMFDKDLLVGNAFELVCEARAGQQECVGTSTDDWNKLVSFDQCLMTLPPLLKFRHCETECGVTYPGDVCTRYP